MNIFRLFFFNPILIAVSKLSVHVWRVSIFYNHLTRLLPVEKENEKIRYTKPIFNPQISSTYVSFILFYLFLIFYLFFFERIFFFKVFQFHKYCLNLSSIVSSVQQFSDAYLICIIQIDINAVPEILQNV